MGAMNVFYNVGFIEGMLVLAVDVGKGAGAIALARYLGGQELVQLMAGIAAVLGHSFPIFLKFRGGKGGATLIGILVYLMPRGIPIFLGIFGLGLIATRYPTLSYWVALLCFPFVAWLVYQKWELLIFSAGLLFFLLLRYIPRLKEMRAKNGGWRHVLSRKGLRDRL
jgi:glycerol-3-phosphate acyltransferase PlsY